MRTAFISRVSTRALTAMLVAATALIPFTSLAEGATASTMPMAPTTQLASTTPLASTTQFAATAPFAATTQLALTTQSEGEAWSVATVDGDQGSDRSSFSYEQEPGSSLTDAIEISNTGTEPLHLRVYAADAFTTNDGTVDILEANEVSVDAGLWILPDVETIDLEPGASQVVNFTIEIPSGALPGDHSAAIVASLVDEQSTSQVQVERRLGLRVAIRIPGELTANVVLDQVATNYVPSWNPFAGGRVQVTYSLTNNGNTRINVTDDIRLSGLLGLFPGATITADATDLLPGSTVQVVREVSTAAIGPISGELTVINAPRDESVAAPEQLTQDVSAFAMPWTLLLLVLIVLAAIVIAIVLIVRRRRMTQWLAQAKRGETDGRTDIEAGERDTLV